MAWRFTDKTLSKKVHSFPVGQDQAVKGRILDDDAFAANGVLIVKDGYDGHDGLLTRLDVVVHLLACSSRLYGASAALCSHSP